MRKSYLFISAGAIIQGSKHLFCDLHVGGYKKKAPMYQKGASVPILPLSTLLPQNASQILFHISV